MAPAAIQVQPVPTPGHQLGRGRAGQHHLRRPAGIPHHRRPRAPAQRPQVLPGRLRRRGGETDQVPAPHHPARRARRIPSGDCQHRISGPVVPQVHPVARSLPHHPQVAGRTWRVGPPLGNGAGGVVLPHRFHPVQDSRQHLLYADVVGDQRQRDQVRSGSQRDVEAGHRRRLGRRPCPVPARGVTGGAGRRVDLNVRIFRRSRGVDRFQAAIRLRGTGIYLTGLNEKGRGWRFRRGFRRRWDAGAGLAGLGEWGCGVRADPWRWLRTPAGCAIGPRRIRH